MQEPNKRKYVGFRGNDFSNEDVKLYRSPSCVNMWKNYQNSDGAKVETRAGETLIGEFGLQIFGLFFFDITTAGNTITKTLVHAGTKLYLWTNYPTLPAAKTELFTGMNMRESHAFVFNNTLFIKDGINYLEYDGTTIKEVVGTIPLTSNNRTPEGLSYDVDGNPTLAKYQDINLLQAKKKNAFVGDGKSTNYYLDTNNLDPKSTFLMTALINDSVTAIEDIDFTVNRTTGVVMPTTASIFPAPSTAGTANIVITYSKTIAGHRDQVNKCTITTGFDNRIFIAGNQDYPNTLLHSELEDPRYIRDTSYEPEGLDLAPIKTIIAGDEVLWVVKEPSQNNTTVFYHMPTIDSTYGKIYPKNQSNISTGCLSTGLNFGDDIVFLSSEGLKAISGSINSKKLLDDRSSLVNPKMTTEIGYANAKLEEYKGYLLCLVNSHIYLADSRQISSGDFANGDDQYEWYYWEMPNNITYIKEIKGDLYLGNAAGNIYVLNGTTDNGVAINSKWTNPNDNFGTDTKLKNANKLGGTAEVAPLGADITVRYRTDKGEWKTAGTYTDLKGYIVYKIKATKWVKIQLEFSSTKPFAIYSNTLESYYGSYVKR